MKYTKGDRVYFIINEEHYPFQPQERTLKGEIMSINEDRVVIKEIAFLQAPYYHTVSISAIISKI